MFPADNADEMDIVVVAPAFSRVAKRVLGAVAAASTGGERGPFRSISCSQFGA
jgi:hypothetical protein